MRKPRPAGALFCALLFSAFRAFALDPIDTDGPDFVESSEVVPKGHFQYEVDATWAKNRPSTESASFSTPTLLKYGMTEDLELRIAPEGYVRENGTSGLGDTALGIKWHSHDRNAAAGRPAVSWIAHVDAPTGARQLRGNGLRPSLRSVLTWDLPNDLALGIMPGIKYDSTDDGHRFTSAIFGAVLNKRLSDQWRVFVESSVPQISHQRDGGVIASWDLGAAYLATNDTQLGMRVGVAANRNTPSNYFLLELAQRF
jgi:hypothetical protein